MTSRAFRVRCVSEERGSAVTVELEADGHGGLRFRPGEFAWLKHGREPYAMDEHPFTISSSAERPERPSFTVKAVGDFSGALAELRPGSPILIDGPHGDGVDGAAFSEGRLLIAAGIGITPAMSVLRTAGDRGERQPILLIYGSRRWEGVTFREEIEELERRLPNLRVVHVLSRAGEDWAGERGRVDEDLLRRLLPAEARRSSALICGPPEMVSGASAALRRIGFPASAVQAEGFG